mmetsp:Transcript_20851/g.39772  ORF Transcript_20851/g.39772 Transcript_20851/m.39772 type:complete len:497 (-) Transcript_20851:112-1602(-)
MAESLEDIGEIGAKPFNDIQVRFMTPVESLGVAGYVAKVGRNTPVGALKEALVAKIDIPPDTLSLVIEGRNLEDDKTVKDNGILEPGPAARKKGEKIQLMCVLTDGTVPGFSKRAAEEEKAREEAELIRRRKEEEARKAAEADAERRRKEARLSMTSQQREELEIKDETLKRMMRELREVLLRKAERATLTTADTVTMKYPNMNDMDIRRMLRVHVPDIDGRIAPRFEDTPTIEVIIMTYGNGLPNYKGPISDHLKASLRRSLSTIREADEANAPGVSRRRALCARLADAFEACQAVQARVIEQLADELAEGPTFQREVQSMVVELKERTLDKTIMAMFPGSAREAEAPGAEFAHMMNTYRQALGITRINHEGTDRLAAGGGGDHLSAENRTRASQVFAQQLDVLGLVDEIVCDVNQPTGPHVERRIDRTGLLNWAGEQEAIAHRIFFNEAEAALYNETRPLKTDEVDDTTQPFIHRALAIEILHIVLVQEGVAKA